jgi:hypothetical protein
MLKTFNIQYPILFTKFSHLFILSFYFRLSFFLICPFRVWSMRFSSFVLAIYWRGVQSSAAGKFIVLTVGISHHKHFHLLEITWGRRFSLQFFFKGGTFTVWSSFFCCFNWIVPPNISLSLMPHLYPFFLYA